MTGRGCRDPSHCPSKRRPRLTARYALRQREDSGQINALLKELMTMKMGGMKKKAAEVEDARKEQLL